MSNAHVYGNDLPSRTLYRGFLLLSVLMMGLCLTAPSPGALADGFWKILTSQAGLITDSILIGGLGAAFFNAGLVLLYCTLLVRRLGLPFTGITVACLFLMAGFSLFGKDIFNIQPFLLGGWLYAKYKKEPFSKYIYTTLFGTTLSPAASEVYSIFSGGLALALMLLVGVGIGFILPAVAAWTVRVHQGYNLYNVGFAAGLIGLMFASVCKSFGYEFTTWLHWSEGNNRLLAPWLAGIFLSILAVGIKNTPSFQAYFQLRRHSGRLITDFVVLDGLGPALVNMGIMGLIGLVYLLAIGSWLNGPTIGGLVTICRFAVFGKHPWNCLPVMAGVVFSACFTVYGLQEPSMVLAALFCTGLAPIAGQFGWKWGVVAGMLHASVVLNVGFLQGWLNLYNNGFSAGLVCIVLVPLIEAVQTSLPRETEQRRSVWKNFWPRAKK